MVTVKTPASPPGPAMRLQHQAFLNTGAKSNLPHMDYQAPPYPLVTHSTWRPAPSSARKVNIAVGAWWNMHTTAETIDISDEVCTTNIA